MKYFFSLLIALTITLMVQGQQHVIIRFDNPDPITVKTFTNPAYDVASYVPGKYLDLVVWETEVETFLQQGYDVKVVNTEAEMAANLGNVDDISGYRTYAEALEELQQIAADHPDICQLIDIGDSHGKVYYNEGYGNYGAYQHDIWALKVSDNVTLDEDEPAIYYFGAHHAREPLSTEVVFFVLNHIIDNYGTDPEITENVNNKEIWFVPIVNPDGHEVVLDQIDLNWRKNICDNDGNGSVTGGSWDYPDGVDPNRNYGWEWGGEGTSFDPTDITYCGPEPFSEPELQAIRDLMAARHFVAGISYHTYSELVLWPFAYTDGATGPDNAAIANLGTMMGNAIPGISGGHYTPEPSWALYPASGGTDDWAYGNHGIFGYTIELGTQFIPPANQVYQITQDNINAAMILLNRINYSTLTGHVTNATTGEPVEAEIHIPQIDNTGLFRLPYMSNAAFGTYYRMLMNNTYSVTFSAYGYISQTFDNVAIVSDGQTILDVQLVPAQIISLSGTVTDTDSGEPIEGAVVTVLNTPVEPVITGANGTYSIPEIFENTYTIKVWAQDYATVIQVVTITPDNNIIDFELTESFAISFEEGSFEQGWTFGGNANWTIDNTESWDGQSSARSGTIGNSSSSQLMRTLDIASGGTISFYRKVSSESGYDFLKFYIDNQLKDSWSGQEDWEQVSYNVTAGTHTFKWVYEKDVYVASGSDCGWVDYIEFPPSATVNANAGANGEICASETYQCNGTASYYQTITWSTSGDGTYDDENSLEAIYTPGSADINTGSATLTLTASDNQGNSDVDDLLLTILPLPAMPDGLTGETPVCAGYVYPYTCQPIADALSYEWVLSPAEAGEIQENSDNEITVLWSPEYFATATLKVRGMNDCGYGDYSEEFVVTVEDCTSIDETAANGFSITPNPASDRLNITLPATTSSVTTIRIISVTGKLILQQETANNNNVTIDVSSLTNGMYLLGLYNDHFTQVRKLMISK
ncbi:MAG: T9SS type A sorting domain-containing protein [Clostridia bacterium]|nr:T9SS type A sorting domain-containing protein [Clostridia bacterium]